MNKSIMCHAARWSAVGFGLLLMAGCDTPADPSQNAATSDSVSVVASSATVAPVAPTANNIDSSNIGVQNFTPGAPALSAGATASTVTPKPAPTETSIKGQFSMSDGLTIVGIYYSAPIRPAPAVLLLHMYGSNKEACKPFAPLLQAAGYSVLAIDMRRHGETRRALASVKAPSHVH